MRDLCKSPEFIEAALREFPLFREVDDELLRTVARSAKVMRFEPGEAAIVEGQMAEYGWALLEGSMRVFYHSEAGTQVTVKLFAAPAWFGEIEFLLNLHHLENVAALEPATLVLIPRDVIRQTLLRSNALCYAMLLDVCARFAIAARNESNLAFSAVDQRLASYLIGYAAKFGERLPDGKVLLTRPLTQEDLADAIGGTTRSIQRTLREWKERQIVSGKQRKLRILDVEALGVLCGVAPPRVDYKIGEVFGQKLTPS